MKMYRKCLRLAGVLSVGLLLSTFFSGCAGGGFNPAPPTAPVNKDARQDPDILAKGDRLVITYSGTPAPPQPHVENIRQDGTIQPPYLSQPVKAAGYTTGELRDLLVSLYVPSIFTRVSITVKPEERYFTVDGEVNAPGLYPYIGTMTVLEGIASARGLNDFARKTRIRVVRGATGETLTFNYTKARDNKSYDLPLYPGDQINAPRRHY